MNQTTCPSCNQLFKFKNEFAGRMICCPKCSESFRLPAARPSQIKAAQTVPVSPETTGASPTKSQPIAPETETVAFEPSPARKARPKKKSNPLLLLGLLALFLLVLGGGGIGAFFFVFNQASPKIPSIHKPSPDPFADDLKANFQDEEALRKLQFVDQGGKPVSLQAYQGKKHLVLVFMRGWTTVPGGVCPYCGVQSSRLIKNYEEFTRRDAEVLLVYPGKSEDVQKFVETMKEETVREKMPFPTLLDENLQAVEQLGIRDDQAKPSTFIFDKQGQLKFGYVGASSVDRPSLTLMLDQLDSFNQS